MYIRFYVPEHVASGKTTDRGGKGYFKKKKKKKIYEDRKSFKKKKTEK